MIQTQPGKITDNLYMLATAEMPAYLLVGETSVLFDAGIACMGPYYEKEIRGILGDRGPDMAVFTHSHFDHCGALSYLKSVFPEMRIGGSGIAAGILKRENAIRTMQTLSEATRQAMCLEWGTEIPELPFEPVEVDTILAEGDEIRISGDVVVQVLETPGHTRDFLSFYIPGEQILVPSEAVGIPDLSGHIYCDFLVDYDMYHGSLSRLAELPVDVLCLGHGAVLTGLDAWGFAKKALAQCEAFRTYVERLLLREGGDTEKVMEMIKVEEYDPKPQPKQAEPAYLMNLRARVSVVANAMAAATRQ
ncbi:MAG: MBL fold metallo-hydrolase [Desulfatibacillaceae bacterium]